MKSTAQHRVLLELMSRVEVPLHELQTKFIGGTDAARQLRFLRARGFNITFYRRMANGKATNTTIYRLHTPLCQIDFANLRVRKPEAFKNKLALADNI